MEKNQYKTAIYTIENDWSAASYWYSMAALSNESKICIKGLKEKSHQGDAIVMDYFRHFGVQTHFSNNELIIEKKSKPIKKAIDLNLNAYPDIAQTIAVTCVGLGLECHLKGLETLQLKETNRLEALKIDNKYLTEGGVFTDDFINNWIDLKYEEVQQLRQRPHPHEFTMYYDA